jgi:hypothetical protein
MRKKLLPSYVLYSKAKQESRFAIWRRDRWPRQAEARRGVRWYVTVVAGALGGEEDRKQAGNRAQSLAAGGRFGHL